MIITIKRFIADIKKYWEYINFASRAELKSEVAGSYLGWVWWILDPLFFMIVYTFVVRFVFNSGGEDFPIFVFIGLTAWNFLNNTVLNSVQIIHSFRSIISKVYLPKFVLILIRLNKNLIKMGISFLLVFILMGFFNITFSWKLIYLLPLMIVHVIVTFAISIFVAHVGVFISDSVNVVTVALRFLFYISGVLFSIADRIPQPWSKILLLLDPIAFMIQAYRDVIYYHKLFDLNYFVYWLVIGLFLCIVFLRMMYKYENTYVKVVQNG